MFTCNCRLRSINLLPAGSIRRITRSQNALSTAVVLHPGMACLYRAWNSYHTMLAYDRPQGVNFLTSLPFSGRGALLSTSGV